MSHTPGPWANDVTVPLKAIYCERRGYSVVFVNGHREEEAHANARLIAASPDLLAALEAIVKADDAQELEQHHIEAARAALAKAKE